MLPALPDLSTWFAPVFSVLLTRTFVVLDLSNASLIKSPAIGQLGPLGRILRILGTTGKLSDWSSGRVSQHGLHGPASRLLPSPGRAVPMSRAPCMAWCQVWCQVWCHGPAAFVWSTFPLQ